MIENLNSQQTKICDLLSKSLSRYPDKQSIGAYNIEIIKSGIRSFSDDKEYLDTSSVEGINNITNSTPIAYNSRPSRANMQPEPNTVWFAKMKGSNKVLIITPKDEDIINKNILSTGFLGLKASNTIPLSLLSAFIISKGFVIQRDLNSVGTTMAGVNNETFQNILVPALKPEEIMEYKLKYDDLVNQLSSIRRKIDKLKVIKGNLLQRFF